MFVSSLKRASKLREGRYCVLCFFYDLKSARRLGGWDWHMHTTLCKIINKDLLYSTGNSTQYSVMTYIGIESEKELGI